MISIDDFKKVELTVGKILSAEKLPDADKLLKLSVDFGLKVSALAPASAVSAAASPAGEIEERKERDVRQIVSGIALHFPEPEKLVGKNCLFVANLEPRTIRGVESNGMIVAVSTEDGKFSLLEAGAEIPPGTKAR